jgi:hypothetical protein
MRHTLSRQEIPLMTTKKKKDTKVHFRISSKRLQLIRKLANQQYRKITSIVEESLDDWLQKNK